MRGKNISLIALSIAGLAIISAIGLFAFTMTEKSSPTPTPRPDTLQLGNQILPGDDSQTAYPTEVGPDWETYTNSKYGYSIKYPSGWATIINVSPGSSQETLETATSLDIFDSAAKKSYPDGVLTVQILTEVPNLPGKKEDITLNGISGQKFTADEQNLHMESYLIPQTSGVIQIDVRYPPQDSIQPTFAAMLSTFQLTK